MLLCWKLITLALALRIADAQIKDENCPNYQYKCPDCPDGSECVYPDSGGCSGAGMPVCQSYNCHGIVCLIRALPCPEECPYSCQYTGPSCCPFIGQPECQPCNTLVPCHETPCPDDCPDDCFYPDADHCCPKSGEPVCRFHHKSLIQPAPSKSIEKRDYLNAPLSSPPSRWFYQPEPENGNSVPLSWYHQSIAPPSASWFYQPSQSSYEAPKIPLDELMQDDSVKPTPASKANDWFYQQSGLLTSKSWFYQPIHSSENVPAAEITQVSGRVEQRCEHRCPDLPIPLVGWCIVHQEPDQCCPWLSCTGEPLAVDPSYTMLSPSPTPSKSEEDIVEDIVCADFIYPCPSECPDNCNYPQNAACPYQHPPACPPVEPYMESSCYTKEMFSTPGVERAQHTPAITGNKDYPTITVTETLVESEQAICPMVIYMCPSECSDSCIRPTDVPCPNAVPPHCPGGNPPEGIVSVMAV